MTRHDKEKTASVTPGGPHNFNVHNEGLHVNESLAILDHGLFIVSSPKCSIDSSRIEFLDCSRRLTVFLEKLVTTVNACAVLFVALRLFMTFAYYGVTFGEIIVCIVFERSLDNLS